MSDKVPPPLSPQSLVLPEAARQGVDPGPKTGIFKTPIPVAPKPAVEAMPAHVLVMTNVYYCPSGEPATGVKFSSTIKTDSAEQEYFRKMTIPDHSWTKINGGWLGNDWSRLVIEVIEGGIWIGTGVEGDGKPSVYTRMFGLDEGDHIVLPQLADPDLTSLGVIRPGAGKGNTARIEVTAYPK